MRYDEGTHRMRREEDQLLAENRAPDNRSEDPDPGLSNGSCAYSLPSALRNMQTCPPILHIPIHKLFHTR
jgi:hypothetical protein